MTGNSLTSHPIEDQPQPDQLPQDSVAPKINSLRELIDLVSGRSLMDTTAQEDSGRAELLPFPFLALVGQMEMKLALLLALVNTNMGGVLLIGPRGTGKTTAVRSLVDLLPDVERSLCFYGCMPEDIEAGGMDAVCEDCAKKYAYGNPLSQLESARLIELPLNARLDDVLGGFDERAQAFDQQRFKRGLLSQADGNILFVDEVNLLNNEIADSILDAAAQNAFNVRRGPISATYRARFSLIGSMNPEEGALRSQIMDRFGLRVIVRGLSDPVQRSQAFQITRAYLSNPRQIIKQFQNETQFARQEIQAARNALKNVEIPEEISQQGIEMIRTLEIDSLRAEITLFEGARAHAAVDGRSLVSTNDLRIIAPMALRLRRSPFMTQYIKDQSKEEDELNNLLDTFLPKE
jgi:magnesium chelatase subunit I